MAGCAKKPELAEQSQRLLGSGGESSLAVTTDAASSGAGGSGGSSACTEVTATAFAELAADGIVGVYDSSVLPNLGAAEVDILNLQLYGPGAGVGLDGGNTGSFDLASGIDANYGTCARCLLLFQDPTTFNRQFFQQSGTLAIDATSNQLNGTIHATITDVTLIEVTINSGSYTSTPVPNGACLHIAEATIDIEPLAPPAGWTCTPEYFADGLCDCGCGVADPDCGSSLVSVCEYCDDPGSCNGGGCPGSIDPTDNAVCTP